MSTVDTLACLMLLPVRMIIYNDHDLFVIVVQISASEGKGGGAGQVVYQCTPLPADAEEQYNMTGMALSLNNPHPGLLRELPPTDSRLRPDQRELELGHTEEATSEKLRLEEKQRETRRIRKVCRQCFC